MSVRIFICLCIPLAWGLIAPITNPQGQITNQELAKHVVSIEYILQNLTFQMQELTSEIHVMKKKQDTVVSFKAYTSTDRNISVDSTIIFDHVESNIGSGYNPTSGVFRAPIAGIYTFSSQLETIDAGVSEYYLVNQGTIEAVITITQSYDSKSSTAIFHVDAGHDVLVKKLADLGRNARLRGKQWTQFSGHLLKAD